MTLNISFGIISDIMPGLKEASPSPAATGRWGELERILPGLRDAMVRGRREFEEGIGVPLDLEAVRTAHETPPASKE